MNIAIANIISIVEVFLSFKRHSEINRNKVIIIDYMVYISSITVYVLMHAFSGILINAWCIIKLIYMQLTHREKKITLEVSEILILNLPIVITGFFGFKREGIFAIIYCGVQFLKGFEYWFKTDNGRVKMNAVAETGFAIYNGVNLNFVKCFKNCVTVIINIINIYRIKKNGENKFYE